MSSGGLVNGIPSSYCDGSRKSWMEFCPGDTFRGRGILPAQIIQLKFLLGFECWGHSLENLDRMGLICVCGGKVNTRLRKVCFLSRTSSRLNCFV
ncbi:hypothetical protein CDAR_261981 [Caerostris darwini]|uniref:Uncharacterized protein n=1 Tax=Caerostris darwini TaxID=1538125 RepID=A0AAV4MTJ7_9ARAC|nr:hypothetical protein CDAR_261981 [Caerostris darwini]